MTTWKVGTVAYYIYNSAELMRHGFYVNPLIAKLYSHCGFCKSYTWHSTLQYDSNHEVSVCDTCNNALTARPITITI